MFYQQEAALQDLKAASPNGRFWIKLDATDIKPAIQESMRGEWAGDADIGDGKLAKLREEYDNRLANMDNITELVDALKGDSAFLQKQLNTAVKTYKDKFADERTSKEKLKASNWEVVELNTLLQQSQNFELCYKEMLKESVQQQRQKHTALKPDLRLYIKNLFKKKREPAATHVLIIMLSEEKRTSKPYAMPVPYIPYSTIKDSDVRVFTSKLKAKMMEMDMECIGTVTDGEFSTLRTTGENNEPTHISILVKAARQKAARAHSTLKKMLTKTGETSNGDPITAINSNVPGSVINRLDRMVRSLSFNKAISIIRNELPPGTWVEHCPEDEEHMMKTIIATYEFRHLVDTHKANGRDFSKYTYIPATDPITGKVHREQEDHNHIIKRIAKHVREGEIPNVDFGVYSEALAKDVITEATLYGLRKQSVGDAERLLSHKLAKFFEKENNVEEAKFTRIVARWHEASDGRGLTQEQRSATNNDMLDLILGDWIPDYDPSNKDLRQIDVNKRIKGIMGFSRETVVGVTSNIESQEYRRLQNDEFGPEHPRAGTTDDVECYFSLLHRVTAGIQCTLKEFKNWWQKLIIQFAARMNTDLPFYVWTLSDRYSLDDQPSFDDIPEDEISESGHLLTRLRRLGHRSREQSSVVFGRSSMAVPHARSIRKNRFSTPLDLPTVPQALHEAVLSSDEQV